MARGLTPPVRDSETPFLVRIFVGDVGASYVHYCTEKKGGVGFFLNRLHLLGGGGNAEPEAERPGASMERG